MSTETKQTRVSLNEIIGTKVSASRIGATLKYGTINRAVDEVSAPFDEIVTEYNTVNNQLKSGKRTFSVPHKQPNGETKRVTGERELSLDERAAAEKTLNTLEPKFSEALLKRAALSTVRFRTSKDNGAFLSVVADRIVTELLLHGMKSAVAESSSRVKIAHLHEEGVENLPTYSLFSGIKLFKETSLKVLKQKLQAAHDDEVKKARKEAVKECREKYTLKTKKEKSEVAPAAAAASAEGAPALVPAESAPVEAEEEAKKSPFTHYVNETRKHLLELHPELMVKGKNEDKKLTVSAECSLYIADLITCFTQRIGSMAVELTEYHSSKTVNTQTLMCAVKMLMIDGHTSQEIIELIPEMVPDSQALKAEEKKQAEEKKAGRKYEFDKNTLPQVPGFAAKRVINYPTSGYAELCAEIVQKLALLPKPEHAKPAEEAAPVGTPAAAPAPAPAPATN